MRSSYAILVEKSRAACIAAVEAYNRASAPYRVETFAILMINAWELLLKARVMKENAGKRSSIHEYEARKNKNGKPSVRRVLKRSRSGEPLTIGIVKAYNLCAGYTSNKIDEACIQNINALLEIRDVATHFVVRSPLLTLALTEISLAAVKNYVVASQKWFNVRYSDLNIASIPISFNLDQVNLEAVAKRTPAEVMRFLKGLAKMGGTAGAGSSDYAFSVKVEINLVKKKTDGAVTAVLVKEGGDVTIGVDEDKVPSGFTWTYAQLTKRLSERYSDFKANDTFHKHLKPLVADKKLCFLRRLNPENPKSPKIKFYNPNIVKQFDKHYTLRVLTAVLASSAPEKASSVFD